MSDKNIMGFSLLHVMVFMAAMGAVLMLESRFFGYRSDANAIEYTVLATESVLNAAFAHYQSTGGWPAASSGNRCANPHEVLSFSDVPKNGWGEDISVQSSCRHAGPEYVLEQRVPAKWASHIRERLDGSLGPVSEEFQLLSVTMDRSGGAINVVQYGNLSSYNNSPLRFTYAPCADGSPHYFSGLMSAFAYQYYGSTHLIDGFNNVFNGIRIVEDASASGSVAVRYNMYRYRGIDSVGDITDSSAVDDINIESEIATHIIDWFSQDKSDGHLNADHACGNNCYGPERHQAIKAAFFFWCE